MKQRTINNFRSADILAGRRASRSYGDTRTLNFFPILFMCLLSGIALPLPAWTQTPGSSPFTAVPPGTTVKGIVECGEGYTSHELYDMRVTLVEVIRGEEAWDRIKEADSSNKPADPDKEYVLARIKFEYYARGKPGVCIHHLTPDQFTAYSANGGDYAPVSVIPPNPVLRKDLKSGDSFEGWLAFEVSKKDKAPLMSYSVNEGGAVQHSESKWFLLR